MAIIRFWNSPQDCRFFKWILLFCLFQFSVDSYRTFDLPSRDEFPRHFMNNDNGKWLFRENARKRDDSDNQRENIHGSRVLAAGKSRRLLAKFFKLYQNKDEHLSFSLKPLPNEIYQRAKATRGNSSLHRKPKTSVHLQEKSTRKAYVFRDVIRHERLNSYAVESTPEEDRGPTWYITIVSGVLVLLVVVALCVHAPCGCLWRRHRSDNVSCPIAGSHKGMCGKCFIHNSATTKNMTYKERPHHVSVTMASNDGYCRPSSGDNSSQYTWAYNTHRPGKLSQTKSKVTNLFKGSQGSSHPCESEARYHYRPLKNTEKRNSQHTMYDPEWTSVGAFLNKNRPSSSYLGYGSTKESEKKFVDRYCRRSRDSLDAEEEIVEYALKLRPRRRQVIELQEFPMGYSKSFLNIDLESDPGVVFDPYRDQLQAKMKGRKFDRLTFSDSDLRQLSCKDKLRNYESSNDLFGASKTRKSSLRMATTRGKAMEKVVHFFPSNFSYDAQFVQVTPKSKMAGENVGDFERRFNLSHRESSKTSFKVVDPKASHLSKSDATLDYSGTEFSKGTTEIGNYGNMKSDSKEHAIDCDQANLVQPHDCASSYVNYGCRSSTEVLTESKESLAESQEPQPLHGNIDSEKTTTKCFEHISRSYTDLSKSDLSYKAEPLAGLLSPIRIATRHKEGADTAKNKIVTTAGDLACVASYIQPLTPYKPAVPTVPHANKIYQPQPDDTTRWKSSQSRSEFEKDVWGTDRMPCYEQYFPEKEKKT